MISGPQRALKFATIIRSAPPLPAHDIVALGVIRTARPIRADCHCRRSRGCARERRPTRWCCRTAGHELSGGERSRVAGARVLAGACHPRRRADGIARPRYQIDVMCGRQPRRPEAVVTTIRSCRARFADSVLVMFEAGLQRGGPAGAVGQVLARCFVCGHSGPSATMVRSSCRGA